MIKNIYNLQINLRGSPRETARHTLQICILQRTGRTRRGSPLPCSGTVIGFNNNNNLQNSFDTWHFNIFSLLSVSLFVYICEAPCHLMPHLPIGLWHPRPRRRLSDLGKCCCRSQIKGTENFNH